MEKDFHTLLVLTIITETQTTHQTIACNQN